jgi:hypothetical protein
MDVVRFGPLVIDNQFSPSHVDALAHWRFGGAPQRKLLRSSDCKTLGLPFSFADAIEKPGRDGFFDATYSELERIAETNTHRDMKRLVVSRATATGFGVYPDGIGVQGVYTFADLLVADGRSIAFVECLTAHSATRQTVQKKMQLAHHAPLVFVVEPSADLSSFRDVPPENIFFALLHKAIFAPSDYQGEVCVRCDSHVPRAQMHVVQIERDEPCAELGLAAEPVTRRGALCSACASVVQEALSRERKKRDRIATENSNRAKAIAAFGRAWDQSAIAALPHLQREHAGTLPKQLRKMPLSSQAMRDALVADLAGWFLGEAPHLWTETAHEREEGWDSEHHTGRARVALTVGGLEASFDYRYRGNDWGPNEESESIRIRWLDGDTCFDDVLGAAIACERCGASGCTRCIEQGEFFQARTSHRSAVEALLDEEVPRTTILHLQIEGVGITTLKRISEALPSGRDVLDSARWKRKTGHLNRVVTRSAAIREELERAVLADLLRRIPFSRVISAVCSKCRSGFVTREEMEQRREAALVRAVQRIRRCSAPAGS